MNSLFFRAFKREQRFEVWQKEPETPSFHCTHTFPFQKNSGIVGPKRKEGDRQIPEGLYRVNRFNPKSKFLLSLGLDYPNASDRLLGDPREPGSDIFIHGGNHSVGCICLGDAAIRQVYPLALAARNAGQDPIQVHIFPCRLDAAGMEWLAGQQATLLPFWESLRVFYAYFENKRQVPNFVIDSAGMYRLTES